MKRAVVICPGRGTYNKAELGTLGRLHSDKPDLIRRFDELRAEAGQETLSALDCAERFSVSTHTRGDNASPLIFAATYADFLSLKDIEVVAVTGNSMGWYSALACAGALDAEGGFNVVNTMGRLMQEALIGGQLVYPVVGDDWAPDPTRKAALLEQVAAINEGANRTLSLSINLGGMLVIAGDEYGLQAFEGSVPKLDRFPMRLINHAAFHTTLQAPIAERGRRLLSPNLFRQPEHAMIDGRGAIWWPKASDLQALWSYTLGHQVVEPYDFTRAIEVAAREFAPDLFIVTGPGTTLGGAVAQSLIGIEWDEMKSKADFQTRQQSEPLLISMGMEDQRKLVT